MAGLEEAFTVRRMKASEVPLILEWFSDHAVYWDALSLSFEMDDPDRNIFLLGIYQDKPAACVVVTIVADGISFISCLYVTEEFRGLGLGSRMFDQAMSHVDGCTVLDSTADAVHMYLSRGFTEFEPTVYMSGTLNLPKTEPQAAHEFRNTDLEDVLEFDDKYFVRSGSPWRRKFLKMLIEKPEATVMVSRDHNGRVDGYGCCVPAYQENWHVMSPLYAESIDIAEWLLLALGKTVPPEGKVQVPLRNDSEKIDLYTRYGLTKSSQLVHMYYGTDHTDYNNEVYAVTAEICGF